MAKQGLRVFDSDMHVVEPPDLWQKYTDPKYVDQAPRMVGEMAFDLRLEFDGKIFTRNNTHDQAAHDAYLARRKRTAIRYTEYAARGYDAASQLDAMDVEGIDMAVLFPTKGLLVPWVDGIDPGLAMAVCKAYTDWLIDFCKQDPARMKAAAQVTLHDVDMAVDEVRRAAANPSVVAIWTRPNPINGKHLHDPSFDPFWSAVEKSGLPIGFHCAEGPYMPSFGTDRYEGNWMLSHTCDHALEMMVAMQSMILGGVLERFPTLTVAFLEANCGWVPWWLWRLEEHYEITGKEDAPTKLSMTPADYFKRQCYVSVDADEYPAVDVIDAVGEDRIVFSTDYPHIDSKFPEAVDLFMGMDGISESARRKILWDNCQALYNL